MSNHIIDRPLRIWSLDGPDLDALDALDRGDADTQRLPAPTDADGREQLTTELAASLAHLRRVEDRYWDRDWRNAPPRLRRLPENHLWDAAHGYLDLLTANRHPPDDAG